MFHVPFNAAVNCDPTPLLGECDRDQTSKGHVTIQPLTPRVVSMGTIAYIRRHLVASVEGARNPAGRMDGIEMSRCFTDVQCSLDHCVIDAARISHIMQNRVYITVGCTCPSVFPVD